jgi:isoquinoline 1-oxidoreductase beta subunit
MPGMSRRRLLVTAAGLGGGLALGLAPPFADEPAEAGERASEITAWIVIRPDDTVVIRIARSEMGQGIVTALATLVAEELECDWDKVTAEYVAPHENLRRKGVWGDMATGASRSVSASQEDLRRAGAAAREMLVAAAAARWGVAAAECVAARSVVTHRPTGRTARFGELASAAARMTVPSEVRLKEPREWTLIGTPRPQLGSGDLVTGKPVYAIDVRLPGMLHAAIAQCPVFGGRLQGLDAAAARRMDGVRRIVELPNAVAVVAETWWQAKTALDSLRPTWAIDAADRISSESIADLLREGLEAPDAEVAREDGDVDAAFAGAARIVTADYAVPFLDHAAMEPQNCTAHVAGDRVEIWAPTQNGQLSLATAAAAAGVPPENVVVHKTMLGGGFGRRGNSQDFVELAVAVARQVPHPVKLVWTREEDLQHGFYRPVAMARQSAALDRDGTPVAWKIRIAGQSIMASAHPELMAGVVDHELLQGLLDDMPYAVPNYLVDCAVRNTPVPVGMWRGINHTQNTFFKECFVDEMAHAAGQDPYLFRRKLLAHAERSRAVLDAAAARAGWGAPAGTGRHRGIALHESCGTVCAQVVEVSIGREGRLRVHRVVSALDCGFVVDPLNVERQTESAVAFALTAALYGKITIGDGRVEQSNFHDYEILRMSEMPDVETVLVPSGAAWGGVGEPPVAPLAPALCNAVFAATGRRIRALPLKDQPLRGA